MKPMLASDAVESKIRFPCIIQPKIDGVRTLHTTGKLTGRSLKQHRNEYVNYIFDWRFFIGFDGEMTCAEETHPDLCRITSSALSTIEGEPKLKWWLFDFVIDETRNVPYNKRLEILKIEVEGLIRNAPKVAEYIAVIEWELCENLEQLLAFEEKCLERGFEGIIIRDPNGLHKQGRSTVREMGLLRIKRFVEEETVVKRLIEGETNNNVAQTNELGKTFRSSHKENKVGNGMLGSMECELLKDVHDPQTKKKLFSKGDIITVSPGTMTHNDRFMYFQQPELILEKVIKFKFFPKGVKDKPRFPIFQSIKIGSDL